MGESYPCLEFSFVTPGFAVPQFRKMRIAPGLSRLLFSKYGNETFHFGLNPQRAPWPRAKHGRPVIF